MRFIPGFLMLMLLPFAALATVDCALSPASGACVDRTLKAEAAITVKGDIAIMEISIANSGDKPRKLATGRAGESVFGEFGFYDLDAFNGEQPGAGVLAVPKLAFGGLVLTAPRPPLPGHTFRNMAPTILALAPGEKKPYCRFTVPARHVAGEFRYGLISFPAVDAGKPAAVTIEIGKAERVGEDGKPP